MKTLTKLLLITILALTGSFAFGQINLPVKEFITTFQSTPNAQLLDVRTPEEWKAGKVGAAQCINYMGDDFNNHLTKLDKSKPVFIYCASGGRSAKAAQLLHDKGFTRVYNLTGGGYSQLKANGLN